MASLQSKLVRPLLHLQKIGQRWATIEGTRRMFRGSEEPGKLPDGLSLEIVETDEGGKYEWYIPHNAYPEKVVMYLHGGGGVFPLWNSLRRVMYYLALEARVRVFAPHFRIAPEHPYPAGLEDCVAAYRWLISEGKANPQEVTFIGESGGAVLVLSTVLALRDAGDPLPGKIIPYCGAFDLAHMMEHYRYESDPMVHGPFALHHITTYIGDADPNDPYLSPIHADLTGFPKTYIQIGEQEVAYPDNQRFVEQARAKGVDIRMDVWPKMWHWWHAFVPFLPEAREAVKALADFILEPIAQD